MPVPSHLAHKLHQTLGAEAAENLIAWMDSMDANRGDIRELRHEMQLGFARVDGRLNAMDVKWDERLRTMDAKWDGKMSTMDAKWDGRMATMQESFERLLQKGLRDQTRFFFLAWSVLLAAIIGLNGR